MKHMGTVPLETERLLLRRFTEEDAVEVFRNWAGDSEVTKYLTWPTHRSEADSAGYIGFCTANYGKEDFY